MGNETSQKRKKKKYISPKNIELLPIDNLNSRQYDIENLVFSGGGVTVIAYAGAVKILHLTGILRKIKRFTGVGTGAIVAALLALGVESDHIRDCFKAYLHNLFKDDRIGFRHFSEVYYDKSGWNSGENFSNWLGEIFEHHSFSPEVSFWQLYRVSQVELCIVVTNVGKMCPMYCHPKTTPDMSIRRAILMSLSLPGIFIPQEYKTDNELCIDGTITCNYPIHVFDGWWLSMNRKDSFLNILDPSCTATSLEKFKPKNKKTLGFLLLDKNQKHLHKDLFDRLNDKPEIHVPPTMLGKKHERAYNAHLLSEVKYSSFRKACKQLFLLAEKNTINEGLIITVDLAACIFDENQLSLNDRNLLLPNSVENKEACVSFLQEISDNKSRLYLDSFYFYFQMQAKLLLETYTDYYKSRNKSLHDFFGNISNVYKRTSLKISKNDYERTVGISSEYICVNDIGMEEADEMFLYQQGWNATVLFLRQFN